MGTDQRGNMTNTEMQRSAEAMKEALALVKATHARLVELWQEMPDPNYGGWRSAMWDACETLNRARVDLGDRRQ